MLNAREALVALACLAAAAGAGAQTQALEKKDVHIAVGGKAAFYYLPLTIAEQLGYFKDEGLDVKISDFPGGARALQAVVGGSADVVSGAYEHTINMQAKKQYFQAFVLQGRLPQIALGIATAKAAELQVPQGPEGDEDRRQRARLEHPQPREADPHPGRARSQQGRCDHRRRHRAPGPSPRCRAGRSTRSRMSIPS